MNHTSPQIHPLVQRFALLTCLVALLPIGLGALVTTLKAGMAFADWPTSDGQNMLLYPWLNDLREPDKFFEHGHRLAGVLIGLVSIGLVGVTFVFEKTVWVRRTSVVILVAVIAQGLLGGMRVRMDAQVLAMTHSITGGLFFTLCFVFTKLVRRTDSRVADQVDSHFSPSTFAIGILLPLVVLAQYILGGMFRHLGRMLHEHVAGAAIVLLLATIVVATLLRSDVGLLRSRGRWLMTALIMQISLGLGSWITKLGVPALGWVAKVNSPVQNIVCSLHTVGGMFLLATTTSAAVELLIRARSGQIAGLSSSLDQSLGSPEAGGAA